MPRSTLFSVVLALILACPAMLALAQDREFPQSAKRGVMSPKNFPVILMDGKERTLSPAAQIRNADNMIDMPASLRGGNMIVNYTEDQQGDIYRVWILTPEEIKLPAPNKAKPVVQPYPSPAPVGPFRPSN